MKRIEHSDGKWGFPFIEFSPAEKKEGLPIIFQLHGAGERGSGEEELYRAEILGFADFIRDRDEECILIIPRCPNDTFWVAHLETLEKFIETVIEEYKADKSRVYLTGMSMGGFGTWFMAQSRPDLFAAIAPVCGGGMAWNTEVLDMPIWVFHGVEDKAVSVCQSDEMVENLKLHKADVKYTRLEGVAHNAWLNAYNKELFDWLLSHKKESK